MNDDNNFIKKKIDKYDSKNDMFKLNNSVLEINEIIFF